MTHGRDDPGRLCPGCGFVRIHGTRERCRDCEATRLTWLERVAALAKRVVNHRHAPYPTAVKRAEAWWMLHDELQATIEEEPK